MKFHKTSLNGPRLIELEPVADDRGYFARVFCKEQFGDQGLVTEYLQHSLSYNARRGTMRGLHFQKSPHGEVKIVSCIAGAIFDVIVDVRDHSPTRGRWEGFELRADNHMQLYIPVGFAHGFQTLADDTQVAYMISAQHVPEAATGYRHDDPAFAIRWPLAVSAISDKDRGWHSFSA